MGNLHSKDNKISLKGLIEFYGELLENGTIAVGGAGHDRMKSLMVKASSKYAFSEAVRKYTGIISK